MLRGFNTVSYRLVYVVFEDDTNIWWLRWLRRGFRHCYIVIPLSAEKYFDNEDGVVDNSALRNQRLCSPSVENPKNLLDDCSGSQNDQLAEQNATIDYLELNPMFNIFYVAIHHHQIGRGYLYSLASRPGVTVCAAWVQTPLMQVAPHFLFDCVEFAKRILGLHERWVFTPFQLYKKLIGVGKKS